MAFCGIPSFRQIPGDQTDGQTSNPAPIPPGAGAAMVCTGQVWKGRQALRVNFLNPDLLTSWELTTDTIIEWANGTPERRAWKEVMEFTETDNRARADIRVLFSGTCYICHANFAKGFSWMIHLSLEEHSQF